MSLDLSRRSFLRGALALTAVAVTPRIVQAIPTIYGDMVHDDAPGLNALFARQPVNILVDDLVVRSPRRIEIRGGRFLIGETLDLAEDTTIDGCTFDATSPLRYFLRSPAAKSIALNNIVFRSPRSEIQPTALYYDERVNIKVPSTMTAVIKAVHR